MSEQWYCPQCGPVTEVEFEDGDLYTVCIECAENVEDDIPTFVLSMQERIAALEKDKSTYMAVGEVHEHNGSLMYVGALHPQIELDTLPIGKKVYICIGGGE